MKGLFQCPPRATPWVYISTTKSPCKGKSFKYEKLLPLQGDFVKIQLYPGCCPGLGASALSGRASQMLVLSQCPGRTSQMLVLSQRPE